jgi:maltooligosyltrehalose trehalohydrolase
MKSQHEMIFGAAHCENAGVRFRLWAPKAKSVALRFAGPPQCDLPMSPDGHGWFDLISNQAKAGTQYQFIIDGRHAVPDPASRFQPSGVHGPSEVIDPLSFEWRDHAWRGRPWEEAATYELHVGTFSPQGTYAGAQEKLDYLADLGVTAIELMPLSSFPGQRNWGYDGVLPFAPASAYGRPEELKHFIQGAHAHNLMVFLDVVYNHFGPEGNYLHLYAPQFFTDRHHTPWGPAINFDGADSRVVRDFFLHNALYWLEEFHFDGLRLDAVHAIVDDSRPDILSELAEVVRKKFGCERHVHLVLENDHNAARYLVRDADGFSRPEGVARPRDAGFETDALATAQRHPRCFDAQRYDAQWNDDIHHAMHVLLTGESKSYYTDYADNPVGYLGRCLAEGFAYQGEASRFRNNQLRGEPSRNLPPSCFVSFLQNHDQVGNRALGERIAQLAEPAAIKVAATVLLLAPSPPLLFMGEEFAASTPFLFFCDFGPELAAKVSEGRRKEFPEFDENEPGRGPIEIPDPNAEKTLLSSKLDWSSTGQSVHVDWLNFYRTLLRLRQDKIVPRIREMIPGQARYNLIGKYGLRVRWPFSQPGYLEVVANFGRNTLTLQEALQGRLLYSTDKGLSPIQTEFPPLTATWLLFHRAA